MLEKLGLPPKPALKGNEWVLDASHCQGCTSAFTLFNRKHHCRRCGGIFCGTCTQQKLYLRGQGEGQVRVCDPCKKLEDAARFELRHGPKNKAMKGGNSRTNNDLETDSLLKGLLDHNMPAKDPSKTDLTDIQELVGSRNISPTTSMGQLAAVMGDADDGISESSSVTPEILLLQAQEQKKLWLALKKEGKGDAALQAFKRGKELERQADSLKLTLRRNMRKPSNFVARKDKQVDAELDQQSKMVDVTSDPQGDLQSTRKKSLPRKKAEDNDDIMRTLKEMGWNDADLNEGGSDNTSKTVGSELADLASSIHQSEGKPHRKSTTSMEVLAHKRRALALKRDGKLAEAKEELKKAKIMERQLEEQEMFGAEGEESDDELSALMRGLEKEASTDMIGIADLDMSAFSNIGNFDDHDDGGGIEVTDMDINDPEMLAALRSIGWEEDAFPVGKGNVKVSREEAGVNLYSMDMDQSLDEVEATDDDLKDPFFLSALKAMGFEDEETPMLMQPVIAAVGMQADRETLQQEISFLKKEALALKRAGKLKEAKEELRRAKQLEKDFLSGHTEEDVMSAFSAIQERHNNEVEPRFPESFHVSEDSYIENVNVTEEDMGDADLAKTLKSLGWQDDETETPVSEDKEMEPTDELFHALHRSKTRPQLQKELLDLKRSALKLRREGKIEEAEEELKKAQVIERLMEEASAAPKRSYEQKVYVIEDNEKASEGENKEVAQQATSSDPVMVTSTASWSLKIGRQLSIEHGEKLHGSVRVSGSGKSSNSDPQNSAPVSNYPNDTHEEIVHEANPTVEHNESSYFSERRQDEGNYDIVDPESLFPPKVQRKGMKAAAEEKIGSVRIEPMIDMVKEKPINAPSKVTASFERTSVQSSSSTVGNLQQEILSLKRKALAFKREGKLAEAKAELREAKVLEKKLELEQSHLDNTGAEVGRQERIALEPSPKKAEGNTMGTSIPKISLEPSPQKAGEGNTRGTSITRPSHGIAKDKMKLQQESLAHKRKALALRRQGNMEAADAEFELAKSIEKQMEELESSGETSHGLMLNPSVSGDMDGIDDIFDPNLMAALKGLGFTGSDMMGLDVGPRVEQEVKEKKPTISPIPKRNPAEKRGEKEQLEAKIKAEKLRAVQLKREGRQSEALDVLRSAKQLEKKLQALQ